NKSVGNRFKNDRYRSWAIIELARMRDVKSVKAMAEILQGSDENLWTSVILALGELKNKEGIEAVRATLVDPRYAKVRLAAAEALAMVRDTASVVLIARIARSESNRLSYPYFVGTIAQIGAPDSRLIARDLIE